MTEAATRCGGPVRWAFSQTPPGDVAEVIVQDVRGCAATSTVVRDVVLGHVACVLRDRPGQVTPR